MCGRFLLLADLSVLAEAFGIEEISAEYRPAANICPTQQVAAIVHAGKKKLVTLRWGLIPAWADDPSIGNRLFNARAETLAEKPSFKEAFQRRRCLIPADGFYEWQKLGNKKKPFFCCLKSGQPFGMAGLYETWISPGRERIHTCTIITTDANDLIRPVHDRMPVIVPPESQAAWLDPLNVSPAELAPLLKPYPAREMALREVDAALLPRP
ncbi:MAG: SOS response-associated peptidase [Syntrophales bacterium]